MKKTVCLVLALILLLSLAGCGHEHTWVAATCLAPNTCNECGETEGTPLGHNWKEATCTTAKTCSLCGMEEGSALGHQWVDATCTSPLLCSVCSEISGEALGHSWKEATCVEPAICYTCSQTSGDPLGHNVDIWNIITDSTCTQEGIEAGNCTVCNEPIEQPVTLKEHTPGDWTISKEPTEYSDGTRSQNCTVCGTELATESFSMTAEELEELYKSRCQKISYSDLARTPDKYEGELVRFRGKVVQVCSEAESMFYYSTYRVATSGSYNDVIYIYVDNYGSGERILEDDWITIYGEFDGLYTYKTVMGSTLTIPSVKVKYVDY